MPRQGLQFPSLAALYLLQDLIGTIEAFTACVPDLFSTSSCGAPLPSAVEATCSFSAGNLTPGRYCRRVATSRLPRSPRLPWVISLSSRVLAPTLSMFLSTH